MAKHRAIIVVARPGVELTEENVVRALIAAKRPALVTLVVREEMANRARLLVDSDGSLIAGASVEVDPSLEPGRWATVS